jgi:hypothetical protein
MVLQAMYERLAEQGNLPMLLRLSYFDERVFEVVVRRKLLPDVSRMLPDADAARFLARGVCYDEINREGMRNLVPIASHLARYEGVSQGSALAELLGSLSIPENHRTELFNFSETWRHLILSRNIFAQRAAMKNLAYLFSDDFLQDAVAVLQYKSDILNHVNRVFVDTYDFVSWRYSVRVMSLAGGYNESRNDVAKTDRLVFAVTRVLPEFATFYLLAYFYGITRHRPRRMEGKIPKWLSRSRARFTATVCGCLGVFANSALEWRLYVTKQYYEAQYMTEQRRRRAAERKGHAYTHNTYFDSLEGITRKLWFVQLQHYVGALFGLAVALAPSRYIKFPELFGDVVFRYPLLGRWFPVISGQYAASKCLIPFVAAPFLAGSAITASMAGAAPAYDSYVHWRYQWWRLYRGQEFIEDTPSRSGL